MHVSGATVIGAGEARDLIAPLLARHLAPADLEIALDDELMLADEYDWSGVLVLPDGAVIDGDLALDYDAAVCEGRRFRGVIALGTLTVVGDIFNENCDGGPFLVVLGGLHTRHVVKGGAPVVVAGPLVASGFIYCEYNHGSFRAYGGVTAEGVIIDDQLTEIAGPIRAVKVDLLREDASELLLPEFFWEGEDGSIVPMDDLADELKARIFAGAPVFRAGALRG